jgi:cytochrome oxidase Cu insertion factor (SCO1/SenC/PrrC family)
VTFARALAGAALLALALPAGGHPAETPAALDFALPAVGTYRLPPIQPAPPGDVLDAAGRTRSLSDFTRGRITLLGLIYTRCTDAEGCPRATWAFNEVRALLRADPALQARTRLVSLSFDPVHDRPQVIRAYAARSGASRRGADWHFLTTGSRGALDPVLEGFGQDLSVAVDSRAVPGTEEFTHTLKVFLIDGAGMVREIYSTAYLMPRMIVNDIRTLDAERRGHAAR